VKRRHLFGGILVFVASSILSVSPVHANGTNWWHSSSQIDRNWYILNRAYWDNNKYVGLNCKQWVQRVVSDASGGHVWLPTTANNGSAWWWNYDSNGHVGQRSGSIYGVQRGDIVQMNWRQNNGSWVPHTAIVAWVDSGGIYFIESNWRQPSTEPANYVNVRYETFSNFQYKTEGRYSIYYIK
jgi:hypothetical protein